MEDKIIDKKRLDLFLFILAKCSRCTNTNLDTSTLLQIENIAIIYADVFDINDYKSQCYDNEMTLEEQYEEAKRRG